MLNIELMIVKLGKKQGERIEVSWRVDLVKEL